jgi:N-acetylglucosaminyldiphosphoundecaprenol N-acetyl-beta-D-mannosaminyltransferase
MFIQQIQIGSLTLKIAETERIEAVIAEVLARRSPVHLVTFNTLMYWDARTDREFARLLSNAAIVVADSAGICWAIRLLTGRTVRRCAGIDLLQRICDYAARNDHGVYLLGARPGVAAAAALALTARYPRLKISGTHHGYFSAEDEPGVFRAIRGSGASILFVGLAMPHQEKWLAGHRTEFGASLMVGVGGSLDVIAGQLKRAPQWMQAAGLEWFYRLLQQPSRFIRMLRLPLFVADILLLKVRSLLVVNIHRPSGERKQ